MSDGTDDASGTTAYNTRRSRKRRALGSDPKGGLPCKKAKTGTPTERPQKRQASFKDMDGVPHKKLKTAISPNRNKDEHASFDGKRTVDGSRNFLTFQTDDNDITVFPIQEVSSPDIMNGRSMLFNWKW